MRISHHIVPYSKEKESLFIYQTADTVATLSALHQKK